MAYDPVVLRRASQRLEQSRKERERAVEALRRKLYTQIPELSDIDRQLKGTILDIISASLRKGSDPAPALRVLRDDPPTPWRTTPYAKNAGTAAGWGPGCATV